MVSQTRTLDHFAAHAVCIAASVRDLGRAAQFYSRDMSNVDGGVKADHVRPTPTSRVVAVMARATDRFLTWAANTSVSLLLPSWRKMPSPFAPGMVSAVATAVRSNSLLHNPVFNAYFYRAAKHITNHYALQPNLVLEHRVDAARRALAVEASDSTHVNASFMAELLLALVEAKPVARIGQLKPGHTILAGADPNVAVFAVAVVALLLAEGGKPVAITDEDEFFRVVAALITPRLQALANAIEKRSLPSLAAQISEIQSLY